MNVLDAQPIELMKAVEGQKLGYEKMVSSNVTIDTKTTHSQTRMITPDLAQDSDHVHQVSSTEHATRMTTFHLDEWLRTATGHHPGKQHRC